MALSHHEQRALERIALELYTEDPRLASTLGHDGWTATRRRQRMAAAVMFVAGMAMLACAILVPRSITGGILTVSSSGTLSCSALRSCGARHRRGASDTPNFEATDSAQGPRIPAKSVGAVGVSSQPLHELGHRGIARPDFLLYRRSVRAASMPQIHRRRTNAWPRERAHPLTTSQRPKPIDTNSRACPDDCYPCPQGVRHRTPVLGAWSRRAVQMLACRGKDRLEQIGISVDVLDARCCGLAGNFGF